MVKYEKVVIDGAQSIHASLLVRVMVASGITHVRLNAFGMKAKLEDVWLERETPVRFVHPGFGQREKGKPQMSFQPPPQGEKNQDRMLFERPHRREKDQDRMLFERPHRREKDQDRTLFERPHRREKDQDRTLAERPHRREKDQDRTLAERPHRREKMLFERPHR
jgi:hypothetical protein